MNNLIRTKLTIEIGRDNIQDFNEPAMACGNGKDDPDQLELADRCECVIIVIVESITLGETLHNEIGAVSNDFSS